MKSQNTKSSDQLQDEVRNEIENVRNDLDEMTGRMSPGQLIDDVIFYPHGRSPRATFDQLKHNPIGATFLTLGTILLMEDNNHQTIEYRSKNQLMDKLNQLKDRYEGLKSDAEHKAAEVKEKLTQERDKMQNLDSVTFMTLGVGLGVITGASLPITEAERQFVDTKLQDKLSQFSSDLQSAINECSNILKDLVVSDVKDFRINLF